MGSVVETKVHSRPPVSTRVPNTSPRLRCDMPPGTEKVSGSRGPRVPSQVWVTPRLRAEKVLTYSVGVGTCPWVYDQCVPLPVRVQKDIRHLTFYVGGVSISGLRTALT